MFEAKSPRHTLMQSELNNDQSPNFGNVLCINDPKKSQSLVTFWLYMSRIFGSSFRHPLLQAPSLIFFYINSKRPTLEASSLIRPLKRQPSPDAGTNITSDSSKHSVLNVFVDRCPSLWIWNSTPTCLPSDKLSKLEITHRGQYSSLHMRIDQRTSRWYSKMPKAP